MALTKKFFCPVNGWDCPYWKKDGSCSMVDDGDNPIEECDDAAYFCDDDENPFVWEDEKGNRYDNVELLVQGYHFINGEPYLSLEDSVRAAMSIVGNLFLAEPQGMVEIKIRNPEEE